MKASIVLQSGMRGNNLVSKYLRGSGNSKPTAEKPQIDNNIQESQFRASQIKTASLSGSNINQANKIFKKAMKESINSVRKSLNE